MDPQCGKLVNPDRAIKLTLEGTSYFFCCEECRRRFEEAPPEDAGL
jgi:YHS domain-containing protein